MRATPIRTSLLYELSGCELFGWELFGWELFGWKWSWVGIAWVLIVLRGNFPGESFLRWGYLLWWNILIWQMFLGGICSVNIDPLVQIAMFWNEWKNYFPISAIFNFLNMVDFVFEILSELGTLTTASVTICGTDTETLTSDTR